MFSNPEKILFILNRDGQLSGFLTPDQFPPFSDKAAALLAGDIMRPDAHAVYSGSSAYGDGRNILAEFPSINILPVLDANGQPVDILRRWQLFFKDEYFRAIRTRDSITLPYPQYAVTVWRAAEVAMATGVNQFIAVEFGVAKGSGLEALELICQEIARIWQLEIRVLGFDGSEGLPVMQDFRDCPQCWEQGQFGMDQEAVRKRLKTAELIIGDIACAWPSFLVDSQLPVGAMLIDVDYYSSTKPILDAMAGRKTKFLPIGNMFFDDIGASMQFQGEALAIKEFNQQNSMIKISSEEESFGEFNFGGRRYGSSKLKACMFYNHPLFTPSGFKRKILHDYWR